MTPSALKRLLEKLLGWCPLYKAAVGGYRYYRYSQERRYVPSQFREFGKGTTIGEDVVIQAPERMTVGKGCFIGEGCKISALGGFFLGDYCALAANTTVLTTDHCFREADSIPWGDARAVKPVVIEDYVWVASNCCILPGVRIGEGAIVGMGAVVPKDVPAGAIVVGNPAHVVGHRDSVTFEALKRSGAARPPSQRCSRLVIDEVTWERFGNLLRDLNGDSSRYGPFLRITSSGQEMPIGAETRRGF